jgi:apolipoprotein N-acyltransferase
MRLETEESANPAALAVLALSSVFLLLFSWLLRTFHQAKIPIHALVVTVALTLPVHLDSAEHVHADLDLLA